MMRIGLALLSLAFASLLHAGDSVRHVPGRVVTSYAFVGDSCSFAVLSDSVIEIGEGAFAGSSLKEIVIPESVKAIGSYAFAGCRNLEKVTVGGGVSSLPDGVFKGCERLTEVSLPRGIRTIGQKAFMKTGIKQLDLSEMTSLDSIGDWAFANCAVLEQLYLPASLRRLGQGALMGCGSISVFNLPWKVESVENYLFTGDSLLVASSTLHGNVESIGDYALSGTKQQDMVELPQYLNYIGTRAMERFTGMRNLDGRALSSVPQLGTEVWGDMDQSRVVLSVADELRDDFGSADQWRNFSIAVSGAIQGFVDDRPEVAINSGSLYITSVAPIKQVRVFDVQGLAVHDSRPGKLTTEIDLTSQPRAVYVVEITVDGGYVYKFKLSDNL